MAPEAVGVPANNLVLGKHSGRHTLLMRHQELGFQLTHQESQWACERFTKLADRRRRIYDQSLISLFVEKSATPSSGGGRSTAMMQ